MCWTLFHFCINCAWMGSDWQSFEEAQPSLFLSKATISSCWREAGFLLHASGKTLAYTPSDISVSLAPAAHKRKSNWDTKHKSHLSTPMIFLLLCRKKYILFCRITKLLFSYTMIANADFFLLGYTIVLKNPGLLKPYHKFMWETLKIQKCKTCNSCMSRVKSDVNSVKCHCLWCTPEVAWVTLMVSFCGLK